MTILLWFLTPIGRIVGMGLAATIVLGSVYYKIRNDGVQAERARIEQEKANDIKKAREAGDAAGDKFDANPTDGVPDDQLRD